MIGIFIALSLLILAAIVSGNNLSIAVGSLVGSNVTRRDAAVLIGIIGFIAGFFIGTGHMEKTVSLLFPYNSLIILLVIWGSILIFVLAQFVRVPISLTMAIVGIAIGLFIRDGRYYGFPVVFRISVMWVIAPIMAVVFSYIMMKVLISWKSRKVWRTASSMKIILIFLAFLSSFTLGENTLGFIGAIWNQHMIVYPSVVLGIIIGSIFLSRGVLKRISYEIYSLNYSSALVSLISSSVLVEIATLFGLPLSNTQTLTSGILGAGLGKKMRAVSLKPVVRILLLWFISPFIGILIGLAL
ncbi:MAG: anion permease [Thermoplasmata archaeon]